MAIRFENRATSGLLHLGRRMRRNIEGVAAIEFAMIVPLLFIMLIGTFEFGTALTLDRRVSKTSSSVADLVSRTDQVTDAQLTFIADKIARSLLSPYDYAPTTINIMQVKADPDDATDTTIDWSRSFINGVTTSAPNAPGDSYAMPAGLMAAGTSMITVEVTYNYTPLIFTRANSEALTGHESASPGAYTMREIFYLSPRTKSCVSLNNTNCVTGNPF